MQPPQTQLPPISGLAHHVSNAKTSLKDGSRTIQRKYFDKETRSSVLRFIEKHVAIRSAKLRRIALLPSSHRVQQRNLKTMYHIRFEFDGCSIYLAQVDGVCQHESVMHERNQGHIYVRYSFEFLERMLLHPETT